MIYQELSLCPHLSVQENIVLGMEPVLGGWLRRGEMRRRAKAALAQLGHAEISPGMAAGKLSVATQQLVEIARALAVGCRVLVLDEPTSSLTQEDAQRLFELVANLRDQGHAIVYISHFLEEVKQVSDHFTVLRDGRTVGGGITADAGIEQIVALMVGREVNDLYPRSRRSFGDVVLDLNNLAGKPKPRNASLQLQRGEVLGIAGLMGAGRTELLRVIFGLDPVRRGNVRVKSFSGFVSPAGRWRQGVGMLSEDRKAEGLALKLSIAENLTLSNMAGLGPAGTLIPSRQNRAATNWIDKLSIRCRSAASPSPTSPAATSRRSHSHACCTMTVMCCCSMSPPAASTWAARPDLPPDRRAGVQRQGGADGQQLSAGTAGYLRSHCRHVPWNSGPSPLGRRA